MSQKDLALNHFFPYQLAQLQAQVSQFIAQTYTGEFDLTKAEWRVLAVINNDNPLTAKKIGELTSLEKMPASRAIKKLIEKGLVSKENHRTDKRSSLLFPTPSGVAMYQELAPRVLELEQQLLSSLSDKERAVLESTLAKIQVQLDTLNIHTSKD